MIKSQSVWPDDDGYRNTERARTWVKTSCPLSPVTIRLDAQFGTPYPRSAGFGTDIGAFIESSAVLSPSGGMPLPIFKDGVVAKGVFGCRPNSPARQVFDDRQSGRRANDDLLGH